LIDITTLLLYCHIITHQQNNEYDVAIFHAPLIIVDVFRHADARLFTPLMPAAI